MKYLPLVWAALRRKPVRTLFTVVSIVAAFLLYGLLDSVQSAFDNAGQRVGSAERLVTISRMSMIEPLPLALLQRIRATPGVREAGYANWFGGIYQDPKNFFPNQAVSDNFFDLYSEWTIAPEQRAAFARTRDGAIAGESLVNKFGWKVGDRIPLQATIFPRKDGSNTWPLTLVGVYRVSDGRQKNDENALFFHWSHFDETRAMGQGTVGWYLTQLVDRDTADAVSRRIDLLSQNSTHETKTQVESAFAASFVKQFADIGLIVRSIMGAVFFTLVLLTGNTMAQSVRERTSELAVLKTLGFSNGAVLALLLAESMALLLSGGLAGMLLSTGAVASIQRQLGNSMPMAPADAQTWARAAGLMAVIGLLIGALPAWRGMRLRVVDALAGHG